MKAVLFDTFGGPEVLQVRDIPEPVPGDGEVLVEIHASTINPADCHVRRGARQNIVTTKFPIRLGRDISGIVKKLGPGVTDLKVGDAVFAVTEQGKDGANAEAITIKAAICAKKPDFLSHNEAAALALIGLTALVAIEDTIKLKTGESILIQGGAGGVGGYAVPLAKHIGAKVYATASANNHDYLKSLGADVVIDYNKDDFTKIARDMDAVFDTVGGSVQSRSFDSLKPGGRLAWVAAGEADFKVPDGKHILRPNVARDRPHLERIVELAKSGAVKVPPMQIMKLDDIRKAHELSDSRHVRGKLVIQIR
jgi:NADPH:quinone reductase-like Zn-dependent oxidoreductase